MIRIALAAGALGFVVGYVLLLIKFGDGLEPPHGWLNPKNWPR